MDSEKIWAYSHIKLEEHLCMFLIHPIADLTDRDTMKIVNTFIFVMHQVTTKTWIKKFM